MADDIDTQERDPRAPSQTSDAVTRPADAGATRASRRTARAAADVAVSRSSAPVAATPRSHRHTLRSAFTFAAVAALVATVAIPAYAAWQPEEATTTMQQIAENGAQTLVVASDAESSTMMRDSYSATTPEEIAAKKAAEAEAAAAAAAARAASERARSSVAGGSVSVDLSSIPVGSGKLSWPLQSMSGMSDMFGARGGSHTGVDMLAPAGTPIYASADGVVSASVEGSGGLGVYVQIEHVIDGVRVSTAYGHMSYGTRLVSAGQMVTRGQQIGSVGSTGYSTTNHVHFIVEVNGVRVDPMPWLGPFGS